MTCRDCVHWLSSFRRCMALPLERCENDEACKLFVENKELSL